MLPFRTEIRNNPTTQTIKIYMQDNTYNQECRTLIENVAGIDFIEIQESVSRNCVAKNLTVFVKKDTDASDVEKLINNRLNEYFVFL